MYFIDLGANDISLGSAFHSFGRTTATVAYGSLSWTCLPAIISRSSLS